MTLLEQWRSTAYSETANKGDLQRLWTKYFEQERDIYAQLLENPTEEVKGTVKELAEKYGVTVMTMTGFLDGINDSLKEANPIEEMEEDTVVSLKFDKESLYKNMVAAEADWLYGLEEWNAIFDADKQKELLLAINQDDVATNITSSNFIKRHNLASASSIQSAIKILLDKDFVTLEQGRYQLYDQFLSIWLKERF